MALVLLLGARAALGAELRVTIEGVRSEQGSVRVAVCTADTFLEANCPHTARTAAAAGEVAITVREIPPGTYAVQAFHDENDDGEFDRNLLGVPREGVGFSNDAPMRLGPPRFDEAAIAIDGTDHATRFKMRYLGDG